MRRRAQYALTWLVGLRISLAACSVARAQVPYPYAPPTNSLPTGTQLQAVPGQSWGPTSPPPTASRPLDSYGAAPLHSAGAAMQAPGPAAWPYPATATPNGPALQSPSAQAPPVQPLQGMAQQNPIQLTAAQVPAPPVGQDSDELLRRLQRAESDLEDLRAQQESPQTFGDRLKSLEENFKASQNKLPLIKLSGFFHYDTGYFSQDANNMATLGDIQDGSGFRRARLQGLGYLTDHTRYSIEMDFGDAGAGRPSFQDVWGEQTDLPFFSNIRVGQYRQPITMDSWTNIRHLEFLERSAPFQAFDPFRRVGAMAWRLSEDEDTMLAYAVYGTGVTFWNGVSTTYNTLGVDDRFATQIGDQGGVSFAIRGTHLLYYDEVAEGRYLLHVGGGYDFSEIGGNGFGHTPDARSYQARAIPEFFVGDSAAGGLTAGGTPFFVDTGRFFATSYNLYHLELAGNYGPAHFQTEYLATGVNQLNGPVVFYDGAYFQAGYFLTGESCGYNKSAGALDYNVKPFSEFFGLGPNRGMCGWGAWEVAARWSFLDLSARNVSAANYVVGPPGSAASNATTPPSSNPGVYNQSTVALNWWWNMYTRVQFNWMHAMLENNIRGFSAANLYTVRFQIEF